MDEIEHKFTSFCALQTDINEHMQRLCDLARQCTHVTEFGVGRSTWAFMHARPHVLRSYDILSRAEADLNYRGTDLNLQDQLSGLVGIDFRFTQADTLDLTIEPTDLLFIDTHHTYRQLKWELEYHGPMAQKFIVMHDTETFGATGEDGSVPGLWAAVEEFVSAHPEWCVLERLSNNNGLTVLQHGSTTAQGTAHR
jgi:hypothetical protein